MAQGPTEFHYDVLPSLPEEDEGCPQPLLGSESLEWDAIPNLDDFFSRVYKYYEEKGFAVILVSRILNLLALAFTIAFSAFLLLSVKWGALHSECILRDTCDISEVAFERHPLKDGFTLWNTLRVMYLAIFAAYWLYNLVHMIVDVREAAVVKHFTQHRLGLSPRQLRTVTWPEVARRIVDVQKQTRLHITRDLTEKDVVSRIMRKENYLIGMLNKGVLALNVSMPGLGKRFMLTKTLEWNLHWCILDAMLDHNFRIKEEFKHDVTRLQRRFRRVAIVNLLLAPFLLVFLLIYFFMRNAEKFYHQPSSAGARRWSALAAWRLREFNELPHYLNHRLLASQKAAEKYIGQFPMPVLSHVAKFVAFLTGSFAALLLFVALIDDDLLERHLFGRNLVWWAATLGIVLAISRGFIAEQGLAFEPELALLEVVAHTHWLPRHWRGRGHTREVQEQFQQLFQFKALLFLEEMASIVMTPFVLYFALPQCAPAILAFVRDFTVHAPGVGDICSMAAFDFERHGNAKYGSPSQAPKASRSRQGKMEKSLLSFAATYPTWEPDAAAKQMLMALGQAPPLRGAPANSADMASMQSAVAASLFPGAPRNPAYHSISPYSAAAASSMHRLATRTCPGMAPMHASIFGSTDFVTASQSMAASRAGADPEERVTTGQLLLQSYYEDQDRAMRLGGLHHSSLSGDAKAMPASFPGRRDPRAALHLQDGHFYAPLQADAQSAQSGWSVGSAGALLGRRGRSSSGKEQSPSSELAVLKQTEQRPSGGSAEQQGIEAARHASPRGASEPGAAAHVETALSSHSMPRGSRHSSHTSSRSGPGSLPRDHFSYSASSSGQMNLLPVADGSQRISPGPSSLHSTSDVPGGHSMPSAQGPSGVSQQGSSGHSHAHRLSGQHPGLQSEGSSGAMHQHPLQGHWTPGAAFGEDMHRFATERSYSPSCSDRSAPSAHDTDDAPFAGEDSHMLPGWGHAPHGSALDDSMTMQGSELLPEHFSQSQQLSGLQGSSGHSRDTAGPADEPLQGSSMAWFPQQEVSDGHQDGLYPLQAGPHPDAAPHILNNDEPGVQPGDWPRVLSGGVELDEAGGERGPLPSATSHELHVLPNVHTGSQAAGVSVQMPDFSDSGGWYEDEHTDED